MKSSLVSVCIPTYNGGEFLEEAIASVEKQTYRNLEIIFSDDKSSDNTILIIEKFRKRTEFPVFFFSHEPDGIGSNWNNCVKNASGDFIKFLFQDDIMMPDCIERLMNIATLNKTVGFVYCKRNFIFQSENKEFREWAARYGNLHFNWKNIEVKEGIFNGRRYLRDPFLLKTPENKIGEPTAVLIRKSCFDKIGYFNTDLKQALDIEFWFRIMQEYHIGFVDEYLVYFRIHENQTTRLNYYSGINDSLKLQKFYYHVLFKNLHPSVKVKLLKNRYRGNRFLIFLKRLKRSFTCWQ